MDGETLYSIGELARRTGLSVKTIRFYSDRGIVAPTDRSPAGYRLYDTHAVARLDLVRTLRHLGMDLTTIRAITDKELALPEVAAAHAEALAVQIRVPRLRHAVLTAVAERGLTVEEADVMHKLAQLTEDERRRLTADFLDAAFGSLATDSPLAGNRRSMTPELPDSPDTEQLRAWVEWAELTATPDFRAAMRRLAEDHASEHVQGDTTVPHRDLGAVVRDLVTPALTAGITPTSRQADATVEELAAHHAHALGRPDDAELRRLLLTRLEHAGDPRRDRYAELLAVINGWPSPDSLAPAFTWSIKAVRARLER
ncbi:MerR family transcriptional regulator [Streptomyces sp. Vc74B-19]|uniref:MerR family transcriptional regulator n=1 Tax=unclassified Streptomyces TaxID=2593676 RepID=UPI001BFBF6C8|nr:MULTISPECIES: MerR family transcriptional regulator [unclassified Streptomyces]MBT3165974.1 MerR family transcriptional regulator [Streptomyces sp. Vc74B-19]MCO4698813.1 MerR family transcriptional regulator [Streptomyces sp. RO-S4]MDU0300119.1 MerR family transcriptional regulator [Streptomyces sp. PAL114]